MAERIENPAKCEVRSHCHSQSLWRQCNERIFSEEKVHQGRTSVHDEERSGRPSLVTEELKAKIKEKIQENLAQSDFHFFPKLKEFLGEKRFGNDEELKEAVTSWIRSLAVLEYNIGIEKLVPR
ncbi:hypothetical protein J437_LFUL008487 [Ladona fulva]|uniref:Uncharacterized protein n=1 Tax=Ladona fulva TaxID=123851 RepID=A0A8K0K4M2_LADFU|nr:hypothetical protein J437_LFUL008487 [Ladona fulva]